MCCYTELYYKTTVLPVNKARLQRNLHRAISWGGGQSFAVESSGTSSVSSAISIDQMCLGPETGLQRAEQIKNLGDPTSLHEVPNLIIETLEESVNFPRENMIYL